MKMLVCVFYLLAVGFATASDVSDSQCQEGWVMSDQGICYSFLFNDVNLSWVSAQQVCETNGGYLAEPKDEIEMDFLADFTSLMEITTGVSKWWFGLSDLGHEGDWFWSHSGEMLTSQTFWGPGYPNTTSDNYQDCAYLLNTQQQIYWVDGLCEVGKMNIGIVCQQGEGMPSTTTTITPITTTITTITTTNTPITTTITPITTTITNIITTTSTSTNTTTSPCPPGWSLFESSCFFYSGSDTGSWLYSRVRCQTLAPGSDLASVHSDAENDFIFNLVRSGQQGADDVWLGGTDDALEGSWEWADKSAWDYDNWHGSEPNDGTSANCLDFGHVSGTWYDYYCSVYNRRYICRINL